MNPKNTKANIKTGLCKLTNKHGKFAHSHILPKSLTRLGKNGEKRLEASKERNLGKRFDSWFDDELVSQDGERILEAIDTPAIAMLRKHKLVWSSWGESQIIPVPDFPGDPESMSIRTIFFENPEAIKLFFLSLVWRAAASDRNEMEDVILPDAMLEDIRIRVQNRDIGNIYDYPVHLHQITTLGDRHNRTPLLEKVYAINEDGNQSDQELDRVRIYIDGLVAHVYLYKKDQGPEHYSKITIGALRNGGTFIFGMPFSSSRSLTDLKEVIEEISANSDNDGRPKKKISAEKNRANSLRN